MFLCILVSITGGQTLLLELLIMVEHLRRSSTWKVSTILKIQKSTWRRRSARESENGERVESFWPLLGWLSFSCGPTQMVIMMCQSLFWLYIWIMSQCPDGSWPEGIATKCTSIDLAMRVLQTLVQHWERFSPKICLSVWSPRSNPTRRRGSSERQVIRYVWQHDFSCLESMPHI